MTPRAQGDVVAPTPRLGAMIQTGVMIQGVAPESAAEKLGLRAFDIVYKLNGISVSSAESLQAIVQNLTPASPVAVLVVRDGKLLPLSAPNLQNAFNAVKFAARPAPRTPSTLAGPEVKASQALFKALITENIERRAYEQSLSPEKVTVTFTDLELEAPKPNAATRADGTAYLHRGDIAADANYHPVTAHMKVKESYANEVTYEYEVTESYEAYLKTPRPNEKGPYWVVASKGVTGFPRTAPRR